MTRKIILTGGLLAFVYALYAQPNPEVIQYITAYRQLAIDEMVRTGVPAAITLAQGIHESEAGRSNLVQRSNNHFGIKCKSSWSGERVYHNDDEANECFRSYSSAGESYRDHSDFLRSNPRYQFLFKLEPEDYQAWALGLKKAGYATNDQYAPLLVKLIESYGLQQYTLIAMGKLTPDQEFLAGSGREGGKLGNNTGLMHNGPNEHQEFEDLPLIDYPEGVFRINETRVILAPAGSSLLALADQHGLSLEHLLDFNDLQQSDILPSAQLIYLQRKRKKGNAPYHIVQKGESLYSIAQAEGVRLESLEKYNGLETGEEPAWGEKVYLQGPAPTPLKVKAASTASVAPPQHSVVPLPEQQPASSVVKLMHKVQSRETLYSISRRYGTTVEQLMNWNNLEGQRIREGQELVIYNQRP